MLRDCDLNIITDGKKYTINDMVKTDCNGCHQCSKCCHGMGNSIVIDPLDFHILSKYLNLSFEAMLGKQIELNIVDGIILPNIKMMNTPNEECVFLNDKGRCSIHPYRPGICRIFPLGRLYEFNSFSYILQINECPHKNKSKIKISNWIDTPNLKQNQQFISDWHYFLKEMQAFLIKADNELIIKKATMQILQFFYIEAFEEYEDFYKQFYIRLMDIKKYFSNILHNVVYNT